MGYLISVYTDNLEAWNGVLTSKDERVLAGLVDKETDPAIIEALRVLVESGLDPDYPYAASMIVASRRVCEKHSRFVGELDHFRYDEDDLPELADFQWGDTSSAFRFPISNTGIPAVNHWPREDALKLLDRVRAVNITSRKEYTQNALRELQSWLSTATEQGMGLMVFYE